jgi:transposase
VYVDESGLEETLCREHGRSPKGERLAGEVSGKRTCRTSIIAGLCKKKPVAPFYFEGYCNTEVILTWMKQILIPELEPGQTIIWDNARFHQSPKIKALLESVDCKLLFLPPYSPDLNPIEKWWAKLKAWIRRIRTAKMSLKQAITKVFKLSI